MPGHLENQCLFPVFTQGEGGGERIGGEGGGGGREEERGGWGG